ncbi:hypothetical protein BDW68DRAFT_171478 [Aspergillus falconensis]
MESRWILRDEYGVTSLIYAAKYGHLEAASVLLQHGADYFKQASGPFPETCHPSDRRAL